jgi:hypothetical protein
MKKHVLKMLYYLFIFTFLLVTMFVYFILCCFTLKILNLTVLNISSIFFIFLCTLGYPLLHLFLSNKIKKYFISKYLYFITQE